MTVGKHATEEKRNIAEAGTILRVQVGSGVHGTSISGTDDRDEMGICLEPPEYVIGLKRFEQYEYHTAWERPGGLRNRSGHGDLDITVYSARKWMHLALNGNPSVLLPLFVPRDEIVAMTPLGEELRGLAPVIVSRQAGHRFAGYLEAQRRGLLSHEGKGRDVTRPELIEQFGWDCYLDDTEFLTRRGWVMYDEIADGEAVGTMSQETGAIEFQVPTERVSKPYTGPIHFFRNRYWSCAVTPNHRMWTSLAYRGPAGILGEAFRPEAADWRFRRADELDRLHHVRVAGTPREREYPVTDAMLNLVGAYVSEGHINKRRRDGTASVLGFTQNVGGRLEPVLAAVASEYPMRSYPYSRDDGGRKVVCEYRVYTLADREVATVIDGECGHGSADKRLPGWAFDLSARQADILLSALMAGDGTRCRAGYQVYYTVSGQLAGDVQALAITAGRRSNMWGPYDGGMYQVMVQEPGSPVAAVRVGRAVKVVEVSDRHIVCFTVPNELLVTRREGRVSVQGNTKYGGHMVRLGYQGVELLETGRITLPMPEPQRAVVREIRLGRVPMDDALKAAEDLEARLRVLTEESPLRAEPDRQAADAWLVSAYQRAWKETGSE